LDDDPFSDWDTVKTKCYYYLDEGLHIFEVRAKDEESNEKWQVAQWASSSMAAAAHFPFLMTETNVSKSSNSG